ncbi:MAG: hypothetical protein K8L97_17105 [Anaerolineae bacterium]|nr:hypothetical protein [Anaerolineae bacterium]
MLKKVRDVRGQEWTYDYYGQQSGQTDTNQLNYLTKYQSPLVNTTGDGTSTVTITLKELNYIVSSGSVTDMTQKLGFVGTADPSVQIDIAFRAGSEHLTSETIDGKTTQHHFLGAIYEGTELPGANGQYARRLLDFGYRPKKLFDANGNSTALEWEENGRRLSAVTNSLYPNNPTQFEYNTDDTLKHSVDPEGRRTAYSYNGTTQFRLPDTIVVRETDSDTAPILRKQEFTYDSKGRVLTEKTINLVTNNPSQQTTRTYHNSGIGNGLLHTVVQKDFSTVNPNDITTTYTYDSAGRVTKTQQSSNFGNCEISYTVYDAAGNVVATICNYDAGGSADPTTAAQAVALYNPAYPDKNRVTTHEYDAMGRRIKTTVNAGASFSQTSLTFHDALNRVVRTITNYIPQGGSPEAPGLWYWGGSQWKQASGVDISDGVNNDQNIITDTIYNAWGLVESQRDTLGNLTRFVYDDAGRVIRTIVNYVAQGSSDPQNWAWNNNQWEYSSGNAVSHGTNNDQNVVMEQQYDAAGNGVMTRDTLGNRHFTAYDALNRPVQTVRSAKTAARIDLNPGDGGYSAANDPRVLSVINPTTFALTGYTPEDNPDLDGIEQTVYDEMGRVTITRRLIDKLIETTPHYEWLETRYLYDNLGRQWRTIVNYAPQGTTDPKNWIWNSSAFQWQDGAGNQLNFGSNNDQNLISDTVYDANGRVQYTRDTMGIRNWLVYDGLGRQVKTIANCTYPGSGTAPDSDTYKGDLNDPAEDIITQTYFDSDGRVQRVKSVLRTNTGGTDLEWRWTLYGYDDVGRQVRVIQNASNHSYNFTTDPDLSAYTPVTDSDKDIITDTTYDAQGRVLQTTDTRGNITRFVYDRLNRRVKTISNYLVQGSTDPKDWIWDVNQWEDGAGNAISFGGDKDQNRITTTVYDRAGRVLSSRDSGGMETQYTYDLLNRRLKTIVNYVDGVYSSGQPDRDLISTTAYNRAGQVTATTDPRSTQTSFTYDRMGRRLTVTQAAGTGLATTSYTCYNKLGWVLRTIQNWVDNGTSPDAKATGGWWSFAPTTHGTDNDQNLITRFLYDLSGRRVRQYDPLDNRTDWFHYRNGQIRTLIQKEVEVNGLATDVSTIYRYDDLGRRTRVVQNYAAQGSSQPINWVWDASNNPPRWEDGAGNAIVHTQTVNGENIPDSQNIIVIVTYDKAGRVVKLQDPRGNLTQYAYDLLDRRTSLKNQMDIEWLTAYTDLANGKTTTTMTYPGITGAANYQVERTLDRLGRPSTLKYLGDTGSTPSLRYSYYGLQGTLSTLLEYSTPALNASDQVRKTQYGYDQIRQPVSIAFYGDETDTTGESVGYEYDAGGLRTKLKMPDNLNITYVYNAKGELTSLTDWDSQQTTMGYDKVGRHINTVRPGSLRSDYAHDAAGRLKQLKHSQSTNTLGYFDYTVDRRGNRTLATECIPHQGTGTSTNTIAATDKGILASPPGTWTVVGGYLRTDIETTGASLKMLFFGQSATLKLGKGNDAGKCDIYLNGTLVQTFDGYPAGTDASISLTPSPAGEGPHLVEIRPLGQKTAASSDYFVRFKEVSFTARTHTLHTIEYTYDGISRLKEARYNPGVNTTAIDADLLRRYRCLFDLGGNRTQEIATVGVTTTTTDYEYTAANQIYRRRLNAGAWTNFSYDNNGNLTSDGTNTYSWDRANHLLSVGSTSYKYDGYGNRFEQNVSGTITKYLLDLQPGLPVVVTETVGANVNRLVHALRGLHAQKDPSNNWEWMVQDGLGSVRGVVDNTIGVLESRNYDPYGNGFNPTGTSQTDYGFTGEPTDSNGLLYLRARYYNPATSVFTSLDPFEGMASRPMSLNGYSWVEGNVPNRTDPLGLCPSDPWWNDFPGQRCIWLANELHQLYGIPLEVLMQKDILELEGIYALGNLNNTFNESEWSSWVRGHPVEALIAGVAAPLVLAGVVAVAGSGIVIAAGTWAAGYLAYNYGPLQGIGWDFVGSIAGWKNVRWAIDTARCTGNPVHLGGAVINAMLGINLFQAVGRGIVNHVKDIGVRGNLAALQQSANQMVEQTGRVFESGVRLVENPQLIGQGFRNLGSNIIELRSLNIGTVTHEITHFFQEFAPLRGGSLGQAETSVVRILQQTSAASSSTGWGTLLPTYWLNPVELHAAAAGGNIFLPAFAGAGTQGISVSGNGREINIPGVFEAVEILGEVALYGETDWQFVTQQ